MDSSSTSTLVSELWGDLPLELLKFEIMPLVGQLIFSTHIDAIDLDRAERIDDTVYAVLMNGRIIAHDLDTGEECDVDAIPAGIRPRISLGYSWECDGIARIII